MWRPRRWARFPRDEWVRSAETAPGRAGLCLSRRIIRSVYRNRADGNDEATSTTGFPVEACAGAPIFRW